MNQTERDQLAGILQRYVTRTHGPDDPLREFYEHLIEQFRQQGTRVFNGPDLDAFYNLVEDAMSEEE